MKTLPMIAVVALALSATSVIAPTAAGAATIDETFSFTGSTVEWTVPDDVTEITVEAFGAEGGDSAAAGFDDDTGIQTAGPGAGGLGGTTSATIEVTPGETLTLAVGGQGGDGAAVIVEGVGDADAAITATATSGEAGFNGGGCGVAGAAATSTQDTADFGGTLCGGSDSASNDHGEVGEIAAVAAASGGGGGATTVQRGSEILVAAAGGGGGGAVAIRNTPNGTLERTTAATAGGDGGGENGGDGEGYNAFAQPAGGGTQTEHGFSGTLNPDDDPEVAQQGEGSMSGGNNNVLALSGGGAGGGWYPGGASLSGSSGGGGSSHPIADTTAGMQSGDGLLRITGESTPATPDEPADPDADDVAPDAVEAPLPETPTATATVQTPAFTG